MMHLKQSTSVDVPVGPFLDETDGKTAETALTITQPDVRLKKNGGAWAQKAAAQTLTHEEAGWYEVTLDATDTNTIGHLMVAIHESGALPVWREFEVLAANVYDSLYGAATDKLDVNVEEWNTTAVPAEHTAGYPIVTIKDGTGTGEIDTTSGGVLVAALAASAITATSIAADAITAAKIADNAIDTATFAAGTTIPRCTLTDTITTYTGNTVQTGDSFARLTGTGAVTFASLTVTAGTTLSGAVSLGSTLGVTGTTTLAALTTTGTVTFSALTVSNATTLTGAVALQSTLAVTGATTFTGVVTASNGIAANITGNVTGNISGTIGSLAAQAKADVNAEVVDCLSTDTYAEPSAVPSGTASLAAKVAWVTAVSRNKVTQTATTQIVRNDADSAAIGTATTSDDGTTYTRGEYA